MNNITTEDKIKVWRYPIRGTAVRLFLTCWLIFTLHFATNTVREIYPTLSLGDRFSFDVSEYAGLHPDIFEIPGKGVFINNNPGISILGAIPYVLSRPIVDYVVEKVQQKRAHSPKSAPIEYNTIYPMAREFHQKARELGYDVKFGLAAGIMQAFCMAPLSALSAVIMFYVLLHLTKSARTALLLSLLYAFATPVFYRTAQLNHNIMVGHFAFFAFVLLWRPWDDALSPRRPNYLLAGLLTGYTVVLDYSGIVIVFALGIYMIMRRISLPQKTKSRYDFFFFILGIVLSGAVLMGYQWYSFGNPFFPAQHYMPPANYTDQGYQGLNWPQLDLLWETSFGMRYGLFTSAPLLLLVFYVPGWLRDSVRTVNGSEIMCIAILSLSFFLFCSANQYGRMQFNSGIRHIVPVIPFLFLVASGVLLRLPTFLAVLFSILVTYWSWCLAMYRDVEQGFGILESIKNITFEGIRFPWLVTLENMGHVPVGVYTIPVLMLSGLVLCVIWGVRLPKTESK